MCYRHGSSRGFPKRATKADCEDHVCDDVVETGAEDGESACAVGVGSSWFQAWSLVLELAASRAASLSNGPHAFCSTVNCISTVEARARSLLGSWWFCGAVVSMQAMAGDDGWQLRGDSGDLRGNMKCV